MLRFEEEVNGQYWHAVIMALHNIREEPCLTTLSRPFLLFPSHRPPMGHFPTPFFWDLRTTLCSPERQPSEAGVLATGLEDVTTQEEGHLSSLSKARKHWSERDIRLVGDLAQVRRFWGQAYLKVRQAPLKSFLAVDFLILIP